MANRDCKGICERIAVRLSSEQRNPRAGLLKRFANWAIGEKRCRFCDVIYSPEQNLSHCPCCGCKLAVGNLHGNKKKIETIARY